MSALVTPPVQKQSPPVPKHWSVEDFHDVFSSSKLKSRRPYLIRGVVWEQGEMNPPHAFYVDVVNELLRRVFNVGYRVRVQSPLLLAQDTDPEPDIAVVRGTAMDYRFAHPTTAELIVEVSDTSIFEDQTTKAELYAAAGIPEYWIVDINENRLLVMRDPQVIEAGGSAYRSVQELRAGQSISPLAAPDVCIAVAELLV